MPGTPSTAGQHNTVGGIPGGHLLVAQAGSCRQETREAPAFATCGLARLAPESWTIRVAPPEGRK